MPKKSFITKLLHERDKFELLLNRVGYIRRMTLMGVAGKGSIKDALASILTYEQYIADRMAEILHEEPYIPCKTQTALDAFQDEFGYPDFGSPLLDEETPKAWVIQKYRNISLDDVVAHELQAFSSIVSLLEKMPEEIIHQHNIYNRIINHTSQQYREYAREIKHWLKINDIQIK